MRCYFHNEAEAVGVCYYCHRAVCRKCGEFEGSKIFCPEHNMEMYSLEFTKHYVKAIDLAREAAAKGLRTQDLLAKLERDIQEASP
ncbi:MAG: hypothetical protein NZ570_01220 [Candidatus Caldarchaeum sp.]|nr:hypothetical protein [Candidatus Caldarchaeum sp.]MDW7978070.1 hypothetical protein [Candidatus Caldarchaeum sp.]MDW8360087.1 hypothetical protein [Candidatus Caldarchaeum sp.]